MSLFSYMGSIYLFFPPVLFIYLFIYDYLPINEHLYDIGKKDNCDCLNVATTKMNNLKTESFLLAVVIL